MPTLRIWIFLISLLPISVFAAKGPEFAAKESESIAFYYGAIDSVRELINYDRVVVTPTLISDRNIKALHKANTRVFAYLSVGELSGQTIPKSLIRSVKTKNKNWNSHVMDLSSKPWQHHILLEAENYSKRGFDGIFLDTLDSYFLFAHTETQKTHQQAALIDIIRSLAQTSDSPEILVNRGFEVLPSVASKIAGVVAESLYYGYKPTNQQYVKMSSSDSNWLSKKLKPIKNSGLEVIVIDYLPASQREEQRNAAKKLIREGYTPYISDGMLYQFGISTIEPIPKRVLGVYDSSFETYTLSRCHRMFSMPIEYNGYVPECMDVNQPQFADLDLTRYAAIFFWLEQETYTNTPLLTDWIRSALNRIPILFIKTLPQDQDLLSKMGVKLDGFLSGKLDISRGNEWLSNHYPLPLSEFERYPKWQPTDKDITPLIQIKDSTGRSSTLMFKAKWGGASLSPLPVLNLANQRETWLIDPFQMIGKLLNLPDIPIADVTTNSGRRILTSHVDGDGFPSVSWFPKKQYTAETLYQKVFKPFKLPQTISIIQGEISKEGIYPSKSAELEVIAKKIFALPNVEIASHTFSHPFFWDKRQTVKEKIYGDNLPIEGYKLDFHKEIKGSADYINQRLAPKGKQTKLILWSGVANPTESVLRIAEDANLLNVNGGNTFLVNGGGKFAPISPTIAWYTSAVQVYAPVLNENMYTNLWTEHFDGYQRVLETFKLTGEPRRIKSVSIYYHMYSGAYPASLKVIINLHEWAKKQTLIPLYLSDYAQQAQSLYETGIAKTLDGDWLVSSTGIRSVRFNDTSFTPDIQLSQLAGWNQGPDGNYFILTSPKTRFIERVQKKNQTRLVHSNGKILKWETAKCTKGNCAESYKVYWEIESYVPLEMVIANAAQCKLQTALPFETQTIKKNHTKYLMKTSGYVSGSLTCP
ncbi:endo alpha-1,4 polygalactosaminidase [Vibrio penaeicida]|uniref:Glycoside-hydrolase family GH114 TIM-barrel domain-containing protein n=1 Tax=Vibrio penaeicida TaxID=104609 RepID=A0AAV5NXL0_9VIBR|nr:endo alpha-1,4 polygalactosaminidase [Vibrio penaeicida]RTZ22387.1 RNA-binding protein [Vibrio penaeicida]GLQ75386.1 hypothetical protein GCM10007932_47480 [Vibrio penaeicida]